MKGDEVGWWRGCEWRRLTSWEIPTNCSEVEWGDSEDEAFQGAVFRATVHTLISLEKLKAGNATYFHEPGLFFEGC